MPEQEQGQSQEAQGEDTVGTWAQSMAANMSLSPRAGTPQPSGLLITGVPFETPRDEGEDISGGGCVPPYRQEMQPAWLNLVLIPPLPFYKWGK